MTGESRMNSMKCFLWAGLLVAVGAVPAGVYAQEPEAEAAAEEPQAATEDDLLRAVTEYVEGVSEEGQFRIYDVEVGEQLLLACEGTAMGEAFTVGPDLRVLTVKFKSEAGVAYGLDFLLSAPSVEEVMVNGPSTNIRLVDGEPRYLWKTLTSRGMMYRAPLEPAGRVAEVEEPEEEPGSEAEEVLEEVTEEPG
jgi:hypothetical protein